MHNFAKKTDKFLIISGLLLLIITEFVLHQKITFMMDDNWYGTNLVTGNTLTGFGDVITSQFWHFFNWGGTCYHTWLFATDTYGW